MGVAYKQEKLHIYVRLCINIYRAVSSYRQNQMVLEKV